MEHAAQMMACISKRMAVAISILERFKAVHSTDHMQLIRHLTQLHLVCSLQESTTFNSSKFKKKRERIISKIVFAIAFFPQKTPGTFSCVFRSYPAACDCGIGFTVNTPNTYATVISRQTIIFPLNIFLASYCWWYTLYTEFGSIHGCYQG